MKRFPFLISFLFLPLLVLGAPRKSTGPLTGYVLHFDFFENEQEGKDLIRVAKDAGARVINLVPPAHVWERPDALAILDNLIQEISDRHLKLIITRVDAALPADRDGVRFNYLYGRILTRPGIMPDGTPTVDWFRTTVGIKAYEQWMEEETRFYAKRYSYLPNFIGFNLGPFSEPFVSQRGGFLQFDELTQHYELTQYTPEAKALCKTDSPSREELVRAINSWFVDQYEHCRKIWHDESDRKDIPFILQFSGFDEEKFKLGYPEYAGFDRKDWVSRADAIGLSIYLNGGYPDMGRSSISDLIQKLQSDWKSSKPVFVLEGGCENPAPVLDPDALLFYAAAALPLHPVTYIYEFLRDPFYIDEEPNSGRLVSRWGEPRKNVVRFMKRLMENIRARG